jgi:hypothetical protein
MNSTIGRKREDYPILLEVKHIQEILGVGRKYAYELVNTTEAKVLRKKRPEFHVFRVGKLLKINRDSFFDWIEGKKE